MKTIKKFLLGFAMMSAVGTSFATPITDLISPATSEDLHVTIGHDVTFTHDITDGPTGFVVGVDTLNSAIITIRVNDSLNGLENYRFLIGENGFTQISSDDKNNAIPNGGNTDFGIPLTTSLAALNDGHLSFDLSTTRGEYYFVSSTLVAQVTRGTVVAPTAVPEPFSLALIGIGLMSIGAVRRRRSK